MKFLDQINKKSPALGAILSPTQAMQLAVAQAIKGVGRVSPNPHVGCVVTDKNHKLISMGHHHAYGKQHAEVNAVQNLKVSLLKGAHVYVTLEPCAHQGKTPSCAKMLAQLPIKSVIYGAIDPFKKVQGQGIKILNDAGISTVLLNSTKDLCQDLLENFAYNQKHKLPFVSLKMATGLDGKMCLSNGESKWITNKASRALAHWFRAYYDATAVGSGTLMADNPKLNIRLKSFKTISNKIVIFDAGGGSLKSIKKKNIFKIGDVKDIYFVTGVKPKDKTNTGVTIIKCDLMSDGQVNLKQALKALYGHGIYSLMVEGGPSLISSFLEQKQGQRLLNFGAYKVMGQGPSFADGLQQDSMGLVLGLKDTYSRDLSGDKFATGTLSY